MNNIIEHIAMRALILAILLSVIAYAFLNIPNRKNNVSGHRLEKPRYNITLETDSFTLWNDVHIVKRMSYDTDLGRAIKP